MTVLVAHSLAEALDALAADPSATLLAGGTDLMVEVNEGHRRFPGGDRATVIALAGVPELTSWSVDPGRTLTLGAAVRWTEVERIRQEVWKVKLAKSSRTCVSWISRPKKVIKAKH